MAQLKAVWLATDQWYEGREREEIDVWGADWRGFRHRLLEALGTVSAGEWVLVEDLAQRFAEQFPTLVGTTFTAASARSSDDRGDTRKMAVARIIAVEVETALWWFGVVDLVRVPSRGLALRVTETGRAMVAAHAESDEGEPVAGGKPATTGPVLAIDVQGTIELRQPAPIHIWSLTAFADAERLRPVAIYQLRPGSIGRALGAGFDLDQIETYLERQAGEPVPDAVKTALRQWTISYRRVRLRRATVLHADTPEAAEDLKRIAVENGMQVLGEPTPEGGLVVLLPALGDDGVSAEDHLLKALRAGGYVGQWAAAPVGDAGGASPEPTSAPNARRTRRPERS
ncbi:MAG: helicase-associated domain-containing protein [Thermomicrobiales bacterium]